MKKIFFLCLTTILTSNVMAQKSVGIVLSGGGALGYAHVGALQALEESGIVPQYIAGASMGAIVGIFYANGMSPKEIYDMVYAERFYKITKILSLVVGKDKMGLSSHKNILNLMNKYISHNSFDSLQKKFFVSVTNLSKQSAHLIGSGGYLKDYVLASSSIPAIFEAIIIDNEIFVDGGTLNNFPAQALYKKCDIIIGVDVIPYSTNIKTNTILDIAERSLNTVIHENSKEGREMCDYLIESYAIDQYSSFDFDKFEEIYKIGYETTKKYIEEHPKMVQQILKNQGKRNN
ncbi:MAG: patatin-like phospholipase family protein [Bacteroidales bacterium]